MGEPFQMLHIVRDSRKQSPFAFAGYPGTVAKTTCMLPSANSVQSP